MRVIKLNEADLLKIRSALEKPSLVEACNAMEITLSELVYETTQAVEQEHNGSPLELPVLQLS